MLKYSALFLLATTLSFGCNDDDDSGPETGTLSVSLQDAPVEAEKVEVTISEISVHFVPADKSGEQAAGDEEAADQSDDPEKSGWRAILKEEVTFDLLTLKDNPSFIGELDLVEGKVTQIRLWVSETTPPKLTIGGEEHEMEMPSGKIKIVGNFSIVPGEETAIKLDFDAAESVVEKGNGTYSLKPTIKLL